MTLRVSEHGTRDIPPQADRVLGADLMGDGSHASIAVVSMVVVEQELDGSHYHISC